MRPAPYASPSKPAASPARAYAHPPALAAAPSPGSSSRFTQLSRRSSSSGGSGSGGFAGGSIRSGGSGGSGEYSRNADPAELFVRQDRIGACDDVWVHRFGCSESL